MSLEAYQRGSVWWARGRVEYNGLPITDYIRESTEASTEAGADQWITTRENIEIRRYLLGDEAVLTFADAVVLYQATTDMAKHLMPILDKIGDMFVKDISPKAVRELGKQLYPNNCTDSWRRWVITPVRAVINNAHDEGKCGPIKIKGYTPEERVEQDKLRGKPSRIERKPGSWDWLLSFREHADRYAAALALFMFTTGARIGQAIEMNPEDHLDLQNGRVCIPGAKGHADRWIDVPVELVVELANLPPKTPRGWPRKRRNLRVFGYASRCGPLKTWKYACTKAGIEYLSPHSAGRHGFGQEFNVRQPVDEKAAGQYGGWSDTGLMKRTYTHAEDAAAKIQGSFRTGLVQAEARTGLKLQKTG